MNKNKTKASTASVRMIRGLLATIFVATLLPTGVLAITSNSTSLGSAAGANKTVSNRGDGTHITVSTEASIRGSALVAKDRTKKGEGMSEIITSAPLRHEIVFVDRAIQNYRQLVKDLLVHQDGSRQIEVVVLDGGRDGVDQIGEVLVQYPQHEIDAIHVVSHGIDGGVKLGNMWLTSGNLSAYASQLAAWQDALSAAADLLIYGCDVATSERGRQFVKSLSALTGSNVAASVDNTGSRALGGNWSLEYLVGIVDAAGALSDNGQGQWAGVLGIRISGLTPTPLSNEVLVNTTTSGDQWVYYWSVRTVAVAADGSFVQVWIDTGGADGNQYGIFGQRFDVNGNKVGGEFLVNTTTQGKQDNASLAMARDGRFIVVWDGPGGNGLGVFGQRFLADGTRVGGEFTLNTYTQGSQQYPEVGFAADGSFLAAWVSPQGGGGAKTVLQRFDANTNKVGGEVLLSSSNMNDQILDSLCVKADGSFLVTWTEAGDVYGRLFDANTLPVGPEFLINQYTAGTQQYSIARLDAQGNFVVVWESAGQDGSGNGIYGRRFSANGTPLANEFPLTSQTAGDQFEPQVVVDAVGNFVVAWSDGNALDGSAESVWMRRYDSSGTPLGAALQVNQTTSGYQAYPVLGMNDTGRLVVAWEGNGPGDNYGVFVRRYQIGQFVTEGASTTFTVVLDTAPTAPVTLNLSISDTSEISLNTTALTFDSTNWNLPQTVTITGLQDWVIDGTVGVTIITSALVSADPAYNGLKPDDIPVAVADSGLINTAPVITSNGGGPTASINVAEGTTAVTTVTAIDADLPAQTLSYSISGGADAAKFTINSSTGVLNFLSVPDYEVPTDADTNNVYEVTVQVSDGYGEIGTQAISVTVTSTPTAVSLVSFSAITHSGKILLRWLTGYEVNNLGFHVYREEGGNRHRLTPELVAGSALRTGSGVGLRGGRPYMWLDRSITGVKDSGAKYWLEDVDLNGKRTWHGPVTPVVSSEPLPEKFTSELLSDFGQKAAKKQESSGKIQRLKERLPYGRSVPISHFPQIQSVSGAKESPNRPPQAEMALQGFLAGGPAVKIPIKEEGWYRINIGELWAAGLNEGRKPRYLQLFAEGKEVPLLVRSNKPGRLSPEDVIEFYAAGLDTPSTDTRVYWLRNGSRHGKRLPQYAVQKGQPAPTSFPFAVELKENLFYFAALKNGEADNFFGSVVAAQPVEKILTVSLPDPAPSGEASLEVALQGVTQGSHRVKVLLNQVEVGEVSFEGQTGGNGQWSFSQDLLLEGENLVTLTAQNGEMDVSLIDSLKLTYWHTYKAEANSLRFSAEGGWEVSVDGFSTPDIRVMDITDPMAPYEVHGTVFAQGADYAFTFGVPGAGRRTMLAFTDEKIKRPLGAAANQPSSWHEETNAYDYIILSHRDFLPALAPLKNLRQTKGLSTAIVDVEDIYDEFSFGNKTPQAIKDFLNWAQAKWGRSPRFVLLAGDASMDPRNYLGQGIWDYVPTKLVETAYLETASDDWFADFGGDGLPQMALGRLPVRTVEEASAVVAKIVGYEQAQNAVVGTNQVLLVADENKGFDFEAASATVRTLLPADMIVQEIFRSHYSGDEQANEELLAGLDQGALLVNYIGHGSEEVWGVDLLRSDECETLTNGPALPFIISMTCLNGHFHDVFAESLAEALLKAKQGGAVAVWASSGLTEPGGQAVLNRELIRLLFNGESLTLGEAVMRAKAAVRDLDIRRTWILFGDPAMRLRLEK